MARHVSNVFDKVGAANRTGGVRLLITEGNQVRLLDPVPDGVLSPEERPRS